VAKHWSKNAYKYARVAVTTSCAGQEASQLLRRRQRDVTLVARQHRLILITAGCSYQ
jgi:hypothetical protein